MRTAILAPVMAAAILAMPAMPARARAGRPASHPNAREQVTYASWYGWAFAKRRTASGELFNPMALTAAHRTLPLGSRVRVTNLTNGRAVILRITDRGPYHKGRGIDVSREAARRLHMVHQGVAKVRVEHLTATTAGEPVQTAAAGWPSVLDGPRALSL